MFHLCISSSRGKFVITHPPLGLGFKPRGGGEELLVIYKGDITFATNVAKKMAEIYGNPLRTPPEVHYLGNKRDQQTFVNGPKTLI